MKLSDQINNLEEAASYARQAAKLVREVFEAQDDQHVVTAAKTELAAIHLGTWAQDLKDEAKTLRAGQGIEDFCADTCPRCGGFEYADVCTLKEKNDAE